MKVNVEEVRKALDELFSSREIEDKDVLIDHFLEAELRGKSSHGLLRVIPLIKGVDIGTIRRKVEYEVVKRSPSSLLIDGRHSIGIAIWNRLISGNFMNAVNILCVRNSSHIGFLGYYTQKLAKRGYIAIMFGNGEPIVVNPENGKRVLSTSPLSVGIPPDYVLDSSLASISRGKIMDYLNKGMKLPKGVAVDVEGRETENPEEALKGGILPIGGFKGFLIALTLDLLVSYLTGSALSVDVVGVLNTERESNKGEVMIVLNPEYFEGKGDAVKKIEGILKEKPGARSTRIREENLKKGYIEVEEKLWKKILDLKRVNH
jgi:LDH2 family malate/lactate/ureidoglycolate dehydrogenase